MDDDGSKINGISFSIDCNNQGAQFVHAVADQVTVADILEPIFIPSIIHSFFPLNGIKNYQGVANLLLRIQVTELADKISREGYAALEISKVVASHTPEEVAKRFESWVQNPTLLTLGGGMSKNLFIVVGSPRIDVYGNNFEWGKPVAVRSKPMNQIGGIKAIMTVYPGVEEGSIDIQICSSLESLENLRSDSDFYS